MNTWKLSADEARTIDNLMPGNQNQLVGTRVKNALDAVAHVGDVYYLDPTNGNDSNDGLSYATAFKTLPVAYDALTAGKHQILFYVSGSSSISLSSAFTWAKDYTHLIGVCSPVGVSNRARIFQTSTVTGVTNLFTVSASGCVFKNIMVFQGVNDATSLVAVNVTGSRNYFENVHFAGIGNVTQNASGAASLKIDAGSENLFLNCAIGLDTVARNASSTGLSMANAAARNKFVGCKVYGYISNAGHALVTVGALGIDRTLEFENCLFQTDSENQAVTCTSIFSLPAMTQGKVLLDGRCRLVTDGASGSGEWDSNNRGLIWSAAVAPAAAAAGGISTKQ